MPDWFDWPTDRANSPRFDAFLRSLRSGALVAFPGYRRWHVAGTASNPESFGKLVHRLPKQSPQIGWLLPRDALAQDEWFAWSAAAKRLARRSWPGPVCIRWNGPFPESSSFAVPDSIWGYLRQQETIGYRCPGEVVWQELCQRLGSALITVDYDPTIDQEDILDGIDWVLHDPTQAILGPETRVLMNASMWQIDQLGPIPETAIQQRLAFWIGFICTGNTCRSPLAAALCEQKLAKALACPPAALPEHGFWIFSAGVAAYPGMPASFEAIQVAQERGIDLANHRSQMVDPTRLLHADQLLTMTANHQAVLQSLFPQVQLPVQPLCGVEGDLADPIGSDLTVYRACAATMDRHLDRFLTEWLRL